MRDDAPARRSRPWASRLVAAGGRLHRLDCGRGDEVLDAAARRQGARGRNLSGPAWRLRTHPRQELRDADAALAFARRAATLTDHADAAILDTLALAIFKTGDVDAAVKIQRLALDLLPEAESREPYETALRRYEDAMTAQSTLAAPDSP